ncbi:hypothetical protein [Deinococcus cellulosilyticus]|uniref:Uncharacterized protein n=1 Tax=Deinococcus cellulosilyticus (strain DSM 18568 / NBRC 106333 / KACC 11606 / 5516J-15) TaxID=1223518 RepID=A0A511N8I3_DEIC1|nr:hypothetical protein [Deinococcus cellulosilyticus]GEM48788.1 hypothetical protein DC3_44230 [Deinococcus cellulosilyticus NBRC 106333 = KACC 11606]
MNKKDILPDKYFPIAYGIGLAVLVVGVVFPRFSLYSTFYLMLVPLVAALVVAILAFRRKDGALGWAATLALLGVALVFSLSFYLPDR